MRLLSVCFSLLQACITANVATLNAPALPTKNNVKIFDLFHQKPAESSPEKRRKLRAFTPARRRQQTKIYEDVEILGSFEELGYFFTYIHIGTPPQRFTVIVDTGSVVTSVPCKGCSNCGTHMDPVFDLAKSSTGKATGKKFSQSYTEGSSLRGDYVQDMICIGDSCSADETVMFEFGCARTMTNLFRTQLADGIMGMASTGHTVLNALRDHHQLKDDVYTLCLSHKGGFFSVGGYQTSRHRAPIVWAPNASPGGKYYRVKVTNVKIDGESVHASLSDLKATSSGALVDSGTTFTYVPYGAFSKIQRAFNEYCKKPDKCLATASSYDATSVKCYKEFRSDEIMKSFPSIQLEIDGQVLCFPPQQYFFQERKNTCVGFMKDASFVIGSNLMMDHDIIFDRESQRIGFARASCHAARSDPWCCDGTCSDTDGVTEVGGRALAPQSAHVFSFGDEMF